MKRCSFICWMKLEVGVAGEGVVALISLEIVSPNFSCMKIFMSVCARSCSLLLLLVLLLFQAHQPLSAQDKDPNVYITKTGAKYHEDFCRYLHSSKIEIKLSVALKNGYGACSVCKPPQSVKGGASAPAQKQPVVSSTQCTSRTQAGTRCKRTTTNSSGKCWQHQ